MALDKRAYTGAPQGYPTHSCPDGTIALDGWLKKRPHWSFDEDLKTRARKSAVHIPMTTNDALNLLAQMLSASQSVSK